VAVIDRGQVRGYESVTQTLHDAFADAVKRGGRGARALELKRALGIAADDGPRARSRRKPSVKKPAAR
jgi:hypothetical protein